MRVLLRAWHLLKHEGIEELVCKLLHRCRIISSVHTLQFHFKELDDANLPYEPRRFTIIGDGSSVALRAITDDEVPHLHYVEDLQ